MELQYITLNGRRVIGLPFFLEALLKAHEDLTRQGVTYGNSVGLLPAGEETASWRALTLQKQLVAKGASKTLVSNHRRGTAMDVVANWDYIKRIAATMKKYGLINDLAYAKYQGGRIVATTDLPRAGYAAWDGGHFQWQSNGKAASYPLIDELPALLTQFSMQEYENKIVQLSEAGYAGESGSFAIVVDGHKRLITDKNRGWKALATLEVRKNKTGLTKAAWDAIPTGEDF
jgi:hypothetical protein